MKVKQKKNPDVQKKPMQREKIERKIELMRG